MHMVGHQQVRLRGTAVPQRGRARAGEGWRDSPHHEETHLRAVTALHEVLGNTGKIRSRLRWHGSMFPDF